MVLLLNCRQQLFLGIMIKLFAFIDQIPNAETLEAMTEVEEMIKSVSGQHFQGTAEEYTEMLLE